MRAKLESWLLDNWYGPKTSPSLGLRLLEPLYRLLAHLRRRFIRAGVLGRPVVVVGNLTAGGSGKTPLVIALCNLLSQKGIKVGVISRGYGRRKGADKLVAADDGPDAVGDEPVLIARHTGVPVAVSASRLDAAALLNDEDIEIIVSDDGLQHHRLPRALEICVIDGQRRFGNGHLLPAGPLREPIDRLEQADFLVNNGGSLQNGEYAMTLAGENLCRLDGTEAEPVANWNGREVDAIAGIGNPQRFFGFLRHLGLIVHGIEFPDHHHYSPDDFDAARRRPLIMTEKDAVKCENFDLHDAWYLPVRGQLSTEFETRFLQKVSNILSREQAE